ncbi:hypothetical protein [Afipia carboxidovorans]|uniref:hypothetical protein n=1 Tax=Afipia carboxidovorans TaxID=40137 RepID=UPI00308835DB|nr:hypothetical protein CRBSH125_08910 [Afipia carboxidovorans]
MNWQFVEALCTAFVLAVTFSWLLGEGRSLGQRAIFVIAFMVLAMAYREVAIWQRQIMTGTELARIEWQGMTDEERLAWNCGYASATNDAAKPFDGCGKFERLYRNGR